MWKEFELAAIVLIVRCVQLFPFFFLLKFFPTFISLIIAAIYLFFMLMFNILWFDEKMSKYISRGRKA